MRPLLLTILCVSALGAQEIVWRESFDAPDSAARWRPAGLEVLSLDPPRFRLPADGKLSAAGVGEDPLQPGNWAARIAWDYDRAARRAVAEVRPGFPATERNARKWPWADQDVVDLGMAALPALNEAARAALADGARHGEAFALEWLRRALPELRRADDAAARAVLLAALDREDMIRREGTAPDSLLRERAARERKLADAIRALEAGWPHSAADPSTWPAPERVLVGELGVAAMPALEWLAAAQPGLAPKVAWLLNEIRRRTAADLLDQLGRREAGLDDALKALACTTEVAEVIEAAERRLTRLADPTESVALRTAIDRLRGLQAPPGTWQEREAAMARAAKLAWLRAMIEHAETDAGRGFDRAQGHNPHNHGALWDEQKGSASQSAALECAEVVPLRGGRSHELHYRIRVVDARSGEFRLPAQSAWLELIPVDAAGGTLPDARLLTDASTGPRAHLDTGPGDWLAVRLSLPPAPAGVAGFRLRLAVANLIGAAAVWIDDLRLVRLGDALHEGFEADTGFFRRLHDPARNCLPFSRVQIDSSRAFEGRASLRVETAGFAAILESERVFPLRPDRDYLLQAALRAEAMGAQQAWLEVDLLRDGQVLHILRSGARGETSAWSTAEIAFAPDGADGIRLRLCVLGPPAHGARVWIDALHLHESPALSVQLGNVGTEGMAVRGGATARLEAEGAAARVAVRGLSPGEWQATLSAHGPHGVLRRQFVIHAAPDGTALTPPLALGERPFGPWRVSLDLLSDDFEVRREFELRVMHPRDNAPDAGLSGMPGGWREAAPGWLLTPAWGAESAAQNPHVAAPGVDAPTRLIAALDASPRAFAHAGPDALLFSDVGRDDWPALLRQTLRGLGASGAAIQLGGESAGWHLPGARPLDALDAVGRWLRAERAGHMLVILPVEAAQFEPLRAAFAPRWRLALQADPRIAAALDPDTFERLCALEPDALLLKPHERLNLQLDPSAHAESTRVAVLPWLAALGRFDAPLGETPQAIRIAATALLNGARHAFNAEPPFVTIRAGSDSPATRAALGRTWLELARMGLSRVLLRTDQSDLLPLWAALADHTARSGALEVDGLPGRLSAALFRGAGGVCLVPPDSAPIPAGHTARARDVYGNTLQRADAEGNLAVSLDDGMPKLITGVDEGLLRTLASLRLESPLAWRRAAQDNLLRVTNALEADARLEVQFQPEDAVRFALPRGAEMPPGAALVVGLGAAPGAEAGAPIRLRPLPAALPTRLHAVVTLQSGNRAWRVAWPVAVSHAPALAMGVPTLVARKAGHELSVELPPGARLDLRCPERPELQRSAHAADGRAVIALGALPDGLRMELIATENPGLGFAASAWRVRARNGHATLEPAE